MTPPHLHIAADPDALAALAADHWRAAAAAAIAARGAFHVTLSGGTTPKRLYQRLATDAADLDWSRVHVWFGDERCVPADHPDSNYRMAREALLDHVPAHAHPVPVDPFRCRHSAHLYAGELLRHAPLDGDGVPVFDLVMLGMGSDGHVASLFPGTCVLHDERLAAAVYVPRLRTWRISLTLPVINRARSVMLLVAGADKAATLARVLAAPGDPAGLPAQRVQPAGDCTWYLDAAAAAQLKD